MIGLLYVAAGGALGAMLRYGISQLPLTFPYATLLINVLGCALMGAVMAKVSSGSMNEPMRLFVAVGLLGGFTTFSAFSMDVLHLYQRGEVVHALIYAALSVLLSLAACGLTFSALR